MSTRSALTAIVWLALALSVIVWLLRISSAVTFERPFLGCTSGCEEEALFSVWKAANGYAVYNNPWLPPFSASYFGWLFYEAYGLWAKVGLGVGGLGDPWLPTLARFFTLFGLFACIGIFYRLLQSAANRGDHPSDLLLVGFSALVLINPLFHWWAFTTRADIWALAWELAALLAAFYYVASGRVRSLVCFGAFAFLAWSFRQTNVSVLAGFGLWLLLTWRWRVLFLLSLAMAAAFGATMVALGENFIDSAFVANVLSGDMLLSVAKSNAIGALTKDPLFALALPVALFLVGCPGKWWHDEISRLAFFIASLSVVFASLFAAKSGASSNYFLPPAAFVPLFVVVALGRSDVAQAWSCGFFSAGAVGVGIASALVLAGFSGNLRVPSDGQLQELRAMRDTLPEPVFCTDRAANLPWILGDGPDSYVFGFAYQRMLAAKPQKFTEGTIADRLHAGRFGGLVLSKGNASYAPSPEELEGFRAAGGAVVEASALPQ